MPDAALAAGLLLVLPAFWCIVVLLLSFLSGWQRLASTYATREPPRGARFGMQNGMVGLVSYRNCLTIHTAPDGLFLSVQFVFRIGHKPLFIPWRAIRNEKPIKFLWYEAVRFEVDAPGAPRLRLPAKVFEERKAS